MEEKLPSNWIKTTLGEVIEQFIGGGTPSKAVTEYFSGKIPFMTVKDMNARRPNDTIDHITKKALESSSSKLVPADTLIIATRMGLGKVVRPTVDVAINQDLKALFPAKGVDKDFLENWFLFQAHYLETQGIGTTVKGVRLEFLRDLPFPLAPYNEQKRIVDKVERLFSDLDEGEALLKTVQQQLTIYQQAILKAAFTGDLTKDWRENNKHRIKSGTDFLKKILQARKENWQGKGKYKEPVAPDSTNFPAISNSWVWARTEQLAHVIGGLTKNAKRKDYPIKRPMLRVANVYQNRFALEEIHQIGVTGGELERVLLKKDDLLIVEGNGSKDQIGRMAIWADQIENCIHQNHLIKARLVEPKLSKYVLLWFMSHNGREVIENVASSTSGLYTLSISKIEELCVPLPSLEEASEIVSKVEDIFSQIDALQSWCASELARSGTLRQSILKDGFSGKLVPQDPADEPAGELLKRIQAERASQRKSSQRKSKKSEAA